MKYFAHKIKTPHGIFDSRLEYNHYLALKARQAKGEIYGLRKQIRLKILPQLTYTVCFQLKTKVKLHERVLEKAKYYTADFAYFDCKLGKYILCEVKSSGTRLARDYSLRRHLARLIIHNHNLKRPNGLWQFVEVGT